MRGSGTNPNFSEPTDDSIQGEIAYLECLFDQRPALAPIVLNRLGELGVEGRADLARLRAKRAVRIRPEVLQARRKSVPGKARVRAAAVAALIVTTPSLIVVAPAVALEAPAAVTQQAGMSVLELRVMDRVSGSPLAGVRLQTAEDELVAITDGQGRAQIPSRFASEPVITLEREGYPMVLIEGSKLTNRSLITMKHFSDGAQASMPTGLSQATQGLAPRLEVHPAPVQAAAKPATSPLDVSLGTKPAVMPLAAAKPVMPVTQPVAPTVQATQPPVATAAKPRPVELTQPVPLTEKPVAVPQLPAAQASKPAVAPAPVIASKPVAPHALSLPAGVIPEESAAEAPRPATGTVAPKLAPPAPIARQSQEMPLPAPQVASQPVVAVHMPIRPGKGRAMIAAAQKPVTTVATSAINTQELPVKPPVVPMPAKPEPSMSYATIVLPKAPRPAKDTQMASSGSLRAPKLAQVSGSTAHASTYTVRKGDMLSSIAERELGSSARWSEIFNANRGKLTDTRWLPVGTVLTIPANGSQVALAATTSGRTYIVRPGDSLSKIAKEQLGDANKWRQLYASNRGIVHNPWMIFPGQRLQLPGAVTAAAPHSFWATLRASELPPG